MQAINSINPAAVLGASLNYIRFEDKSVAGAYMQAYRDSKRTGKMSGTVFVNDLSTVLRIKALPALAADYWVQNWDNAHSLQLRSVPYESLVALVGEMYRLGVRPSDPLLREQAQVASTGRVPSDYQQAYDQFVADSDRLLSRIDAQRLAPLAKAKAKGIRSTVSPRRARVLSAGPKGIHVFPDSYDARYARVYMYGLDEAEGFIVRDIAYDHYESQGQRVQVFHA